ncbi:hypothetical protein PIB30_099603 [Stylosanthes scabra]|uniref:Uncharacterized protein n=1 Tax=Stylosanthes scabra TaxID=79078 RepID=A0ABU6QW88_9FABA|nr:hypothetical protein [Stylosanthes scabra]
MLRNDNDAMAMAKVGVKEEIVELFVVHKTRDDKEVSTDVQLHGSAAKSVGKVGPSSIVVIDALGKTNMTNIGSASGEESDGSEEKEGSDASEDEDYEPKDEESDSDNDSWSDDSRDADETEDSVAEVDFGDSDDDKKVTAGLFDVHIRSGPIQFERGQSSQNKNDIAEQVTQNKGKEKIVKGLGDEEEGYDSEDMARTPPKAWKNRE